MQLKIKLEKTSKALNLRYNDWNYRILTNDTKLRDDFYSMFRHLYCEETFDPGNRIIHIKKDIELYIITDIYSNQTFCCTQDEVYGKIIEILFYPTLFCGENYFYLHGGAVVKNDKCICFLAPSNTGKTTLTIDFLKQGYDYLTDDIIPIDLIRLTTQGFPKPLFLRSNSIHKNNIDIHVENGDFSRTIYVPQTCHKGPVKINRIYILNRDVKYIENCSCVELQSAEKFGTLINNIYYTSNKIHLVKSIAKIINCVNLYNVYYYDSQQAIEMMSAESGKSFGASRRKQT